MGACFHVVSPIDGFQASARPAISSAAVLPVTAQCSLFCTVLKNLASSFGSNHPDFPESCLLGQLTAAVIVAEMLAHGADVDTEQLGHASLIEPECLGFIEHFDAHGVIRGAVEDQLAFLRDLVGHIVRIGLRIERRRAPGSFASAMHSPGQCRRNGESLASDAIVQKCATNG